eukprot:7018801-Prorocentrum_lima.AAC.1
MTSSLVGSEMCIRDSDKLVARHANPRDIPHSTSNNTPGETPCPITPDAVSYTHLTLPTICSV